MARLLLFLRRPASLSDDEAAAWVREQAAPLAALAEVDSVELTRLTTPALMGGADCEWLIEMQCRRREDAAEVARLPACRDLVADLRLLGMRPRLAVADGTEPLEAARWR
jgi:hypothetical protein